MQDISAADSNMESKNTNSNNMESNSAFTQNFAQNSPISPSIATSSDTAPTIARDSATFTSHFAGDSTDITPPLCGGETIQKNQALMPSKDSINTQNLDSKENNKIVDSIILDTKNSKIDNVPTSLQIKIQERTQERSFKINLSNLDSNCRKKIIESFENKTYTIEDILSMFILNLRNQAMAEVQIIEILDKINH